jgi:cation transport ATPase
MTSDQAFDILEIHDHNIDEASLKRAFYSAARRTHPDSNPGDEDAEIKFRRINEAYAVLREYLKYEDQTTGTAKFSQKQGSGTATPPEKDVWSAYSAADIQFAKQRHEDASEKAAETIRNHMRREKEQARQEAKERAAKREEERKQDEQENTAVHQFESRLVLFWKKHIASNRRLTHVVFFLLLLLMALWAGTVILGASAGIVNLVQIFAAIAKWILIVWVSGKVTAIVHNNWKNRILSTFAFLVSMELVIVLMNCLEDIVRSLANHTF